eukprot:TRINITY_DN4820_c0_g2_i1.p1 TRINITY_DN4820_c0_g2~~TRINITY_DN4820_c0_g2_i1.p1  ORF type:complete len:185 (+),score=40.67 TRINITY_DN4820_c0_g2_i1:34-588(+)
MSEARCRRFKVSHAKPYVQAICNDIIEDSHKKREQYFLKMRAAQVCGADRSLDEGKSEAEAMEELQVKIKQAEAEMFPAPSEGDIEQLKLALNRIVLQIHPSPHPEHMKEFCNEEMRNLHCSNSLAYKDTVMHSSGNTQLNIEAKENNFFNAALNAKSVGTGKEVGEVVFGDSGSCSYSSLINF